MQVRAKVNEMLHCGTGETDEAFGAPAESSAFPDFDFRVNQNYLYTVFHVFC